MTLRECYARIGGDYEDAVVRLTGEDVVERFALQFLSDASFDRLCACVQTGRAEDAFHAAHTLKGLSQSLGFTALYGVVQVLLDRLRGGMPHDAPQLLAQVEAEYSRVTCALRMLRDSVTAGG